MKTVTLNASSLLSKWGFLDGDLLDDVHECDSHEALVSLVKTHLLPLLPGVEVDVFHTHHNPIRATVATAHLVNADISVVVDLGEQP